MKRLVDIFFLLIFSFAAQAQSDNLCPQTGVPVLSINACGGPTNYNVPTTYTIDNVANVPTGTTCVTASNNKRDGWYKFTATAVSTTIIATVVTRDIALVAYTGNCGAMTEIGCINAGGNGVTETLNIVTVIGTTYYVRLIKNASTTGAMAGLISILSPVTNNDCPGAVTLTPSIAGGGCNQTCGQTYNATASAPASACAGSANGDVWYQFTATQIQHVITVGGSSLFDPVIELLSGNCGSLTSLACVNLTGNGGIENLTYSNFVPGTTYYIRVYDFGPTLPGTFEFYICVTSPVIPLCPASLGGGTVNIGSLPYNAIGITTTGMGDDFTQTNTIIGGSSTYYQGNDAVFIFTPAVTGTISITLTSGSTNVGMMLYNGCPFIGSGSTCIDFSQSASGNQFICNNVTAGTQYYLIVDRNNAGGSIPSYNLTITAPATGPTGATCATAVPISSLPYSIANQSTLCKGDDYNNSSTGSCASLYESGEDMVFSYTAPSSQCIHITLSNTSSAQAGFCLYQNCPGSASANCLGYNGGGNVSANFTLPGAGTYYIVVDSWSPPTSVTFNLDVSTTAATSPNDYPCNATPLPLGLMLPGDNGCSTGLLEPAAPSCWTGGALNTVWYSVTPTGTSLNIRTFLGTLTNTQIALYRASCAALIQVTPLASTCNTDITSCGTNTTLNSELLVGGLTPFQTYYIRVDGELNMTGTFGIIAVDGGAGLPYVYGQDCNLPLPVCQNSITVGDPGYSGNGNYCEFGSGVNCLATGETGSAWYRLPISTNGTLTFDIIPNDWPGAPSTISTDYDFAIWEVGMSGITCSQLAANVPVRCNYNLLGVTGCYGVGNSPAAYPGFNNSYENGIPVLAGQVYMLLISNANGSSSGFTLNISSSPDPVNYSGSPVGLNWLGGSNSSWGVTGNWGSCTIPNCAIDASINAGPINQPVVMSNQTVKNLFINAGSSLTLNANVTLSVCGNFVNNGSLITSPGSTVKFIGAGAQTISGNFIGANSFANLTMQKPSGTLTLLNNIDIDENDSLISGLFNSNAKYIRVKKNLYNADGPLTHISPATGSTYEFNGNAPQTFTNIGDEIEFNNVFMNQSVASSLILGIGAFNNLNVLGILNLTNGEIITNAKEVVEKNPANASVISYSLSSYVEGNLRRYLNTNAIGIYDFPVGNAVKKYQLARIDFTSPTQIPQLVANFTSWPVVPVGPVSFECPNVNYSFFPALDNGYWTISASSNAGTGIYNMTLFNLNYTNPLNGWTVMKRTPAGSGAWALDGTCVVTSTAPATIRAGMSGFSDFATAQSAIPLPIELLHFDAVVKHSGVLTEWETASEINNDYFEIERSSDNFKFEKTGIVDGAGTSTQHHSYSFLDADPGTGIFYYRLKQIDFDGNHTYSDVIAVKLNGSINEISIYPNPASSIINFDFEASDNSKVKLQILNMMGKIIHDENKDVRKGIVSLQLDIKELPEGVYYLKIIENDEVYKGKFVKFRK